MTPEQQKALDALERLHNEVLAARDGYLLPDDYETIRAALSREVVTVPVIEYLTPEVVDALEGDYWMGNMASYEYDAFWKAAKWIAENAGKAVAETRADSEIAEKRIAEIPSNSWQPIETAPRDGSALRAILEYDAETDDIPLGTEVKHRGLSAYNWRKAIVREILSRIEAAPKDGV